MRDGLSEFISYAYRLLSTSWHIVVKSVCKSRALLLWVGLLLVVELGRESRVVWYVAVGELDLGALLLSQVGRGCVCAEVVLQILLLCLAELRGDRLEGRENRVGDAEGLLRLGSERYWEVDLIELNGAILVSRIAIS